MIKNIIFAILLFCSPPLLFAQEKYIAVFPEHVPPYYIYKDGHTTGGFGNELLARLAARLNISIEFKAMPSRQATIQMIKSGQAHIIPNTVKTDKRTDFLLFSDAYQSNPNAIITRKDQDIESIQDLADKKK